MLAQDPAFLDPQLVQSCAAMEAKTHLSADPAWCGHIVDLGERSAQVALETTDAMTVDEQGLVHGGFVFGLADYAAMLAVNDPNVVLAGAETRFLKPVQRGDRVIARARTIATRGRKHEVEVDAVVGSKLVFKGTFSCIVLERHVLEHARSR